MPKKPSTPVRSLIRGLVRASWHKQNFYNLLKKVHIEGEGNLYQQKWRGKKETRAYHGDFLTEHKWQGLFTKKLEGSEKLGEKSKKEDEPIPWALQTYAPLERRLDVALFRAMFASSPKQAREFIGLRGVKINGKVAKHGFHPLRPGDVLSVEPDLVLRAVGRDKPTQAWSEHIDSLQKIEFEKFKKECEHNPEGMWKKKFTPISIDGPYEASKLYRKVRSLASERIRQQIIELKKDISDDLPQLLKQEYAAVEALREDVTNKQRLNIEDPKIKELTIALVEATEPGSLSADVEADNDAKEKSNVKDLATAIVRRRNELAVDEKVKFEQSLHYPDSYYHDKWYLPYFEEYSGRELPWQEGPYGLQDPSKPYFTPWTPRTFLAPFAIYPSHLEVSFDTCHAVYLRDPIARSGHSEVISPLPLDYHQLAYMFYARDRM
ncbi:hypothetical protein V1514DRAFT_360112 [Lipomyces japonicus]|uniref:mitochondrial 37S ribosomal protein uS4m n=1 Tax=Lipomyces japonicus TaxID=56871 RepID=UPI0034CE55E3